MATRFEIIKRFLEGSTHADLANLYSANMECQVNVAQDGGEPISGEFQGKRWRGWTKDGIQWKSFRIPYNANSEEATYEDRPLGFNFEEHVEAIGMTGWDWVNHCSRWVGFDFDAITGHADSHTRKCSDEELADIQRILTSIPWVTLRYSTSGNGLHVYVFLDLVPTKTHTEHQALARSILNLLSALTGFDFNMKVDARGGNMWVWHRKMRGTRGLSLIKSGEALRDIPPNWKDHINVISGRRSKTMPTFTGLPGDVEDTDFDKLTGQRQKVKLDANHRRLIHWLNDNHHKTDYSWWWDDDHHMLVTHTLLLKIAHEELGLKGYFETNSRGSSSQNCFLFPVRGGSWVVRRYSPGVEEHTSWSQDGSTYTMTYLNREPDLGSLARAFGGNELQRGGFAFKEWSIAQQVLLKLGADVKLPQAMNGRSTTLRHHKDGPQRIVACVHKEPLDTIDSPGWQPERSHWVKIVNVKTPPPNEMPESDTFDELIRHAVSEARHDAGWAVKTGNHWNIEPLQHVRAALASMGYKNADANMVIGTAVFKHWTLKHEPFKPEYPGNRVWNFNAPQLRFTPTLNIDALSFPTWNKVFDHLGRGIDLAVQTSDWCKANSVLTGADWLKLWVAIVFQRPSERLPYLFFYSEEENTGKSSFVDSLRLLTTSGVQRADQALSDSGGFNGELAGCVIASVEETDLGHNGAAMNRLKDWVTSPVIPIRAKRMTPYDATNYTHWVQTANSHAFCPISAGDTRVTMIEVGTIPQHEQIPKGVMMTLLEKEAPDFLAYILGLEIPQSQDRLALPVLDTEIKLLAAANNRLPITRFIEEEMHEAPGYTVTFADVYHRFQQWLDPILRTEWTKIKFSKNMPPKFPSGRLRSKQGAWIANLSFDPPAERRARLRLVCEGKTNYLVPENNGNGEGNGHPGNQRPHPPLSGAVQGGLDATGQERRP